MPVPGSVIDGVGVGYGSIAITFSSSGIYIAENFVVNRPVQTAQDRKTDGTVGRTRVVADFITGSATLQAPAGSTGWPQFGEYFTVTLDTNYGAETFYIMPPAVNYTNDPSALRKIEITFNKQNTGTLSTTAPAAA